MKKRMHIKCDLSGKARDDHIDCLFKDNIISYFDDDYKMTIDIDNHKIYRENNDIKYEIDLKKEKIIIKYNDLEFDKKIKILEKKINNFKFSVKYLLVDEDIINFYEIKWQNILILYIKDAISLLFIF